MVDTFKGKLIEKFFLSDDVLFLSFNVSKIFFFEAGQFISLMLKMDGVQKPRSYSILNQPSKIGKIDLCVGLVEGGFASEIFEKMKIGEEITMKGPMGHFLFDEKTRNKHIFIAVGTGVTPFYSMIKEYMGTCKKMKLIFGAKLQSGLLFHDEFLSLKAENDNFDYLPTITKGTWNGKMGRVQEHLEDNFENKTFYICGLKELVLETKELLLSKGVKPEDIKFERYT